MLITYDFGHGTGQDRGANGYRNEEHDCREYGALVIQKLQKLGHTCYNCTPSASPPLTLGQSLAYRVNKANSIGSQLHLCFHVNAFQTDKATGCEVEYASSSGQAYASKVSAEIASGLGLTNRGAKNQPGLYVLRHTAMTAILVEPFFCDNKNDCNKYNAEKLATAIVKGITGQTISSGEQTTSTAQAVPNYDTSIPTGANIFPIPNTPFYIEKRTDGDMGIHLDRGNYLTLRKGGAPVVVYNNNKGQGGSKVLF
ncbi:MAG: N-acetylmuramoyl-L-alanine amidase [Clostridium sp.]|jgi:N-acetylmuramoyl-L-alanine amidase|uniref:N-acetylmuramoyl-L-alanine amidase n=1 Tax=Clostridium sp. TaxID=1506 RepID=UPI0025C52690|nr:N-acetylmuramoyl-L-alanine amidase [Clostridium sp.]MCH3962703.1 N-acetylmuramoyl-L-alanine amidase [Clostridium sp.]MCI1715883.1 N-acetylmuramoyl-L-alanine amidase [Clostridium sp.]MCI1799913.1 N-acetylmuramoyl-L-alanine amidase [Clostridium sp.]MCI2202100.1 N-acetylmuramoyl-L-alanine amidase [Clostridium sp.]